MSELATSENCQGKVCNAPLAQFYDPPPFRHIHLCVWMSFMQGAKTILDGTEHGCGNSMDLFWTNDFARPDFNNDSVVNKPCSVKIKPDKAELSLGIYIN